MKGKSIKKAKKNKSNLHMHIDSNFNKLKLCLLFLLSPEILRSRMQAMVEE